MTSKNQIANLYIFNRDLRVDNNELLARAVAESHQNGSGLLCLFCVQPFEFNSAYSALPTMGEARYTFMVEGINDIRTQLGKLGLKLMVRVGAVQDVVAELMSRLTLKKIFQAETCGWYEQLNQSITKQMLSEQSPETRFETAYISTLFKLEQLPFEINNLPKHFTPFRKKVEQLYELKPTDKPKYIFADETSIQDDSDALPPSKGSLGYGFKGGSSAASEHLISYFSSKAPSNYKDDRNELLGWSNSTKFSPWLAMGCISPHQIMYHLRDYEAKYGANESTYWIFFELLWREFFYWNAIKQGAQLFHNRTTGNKTMTTQTSQSDDASEQRFAQWAQGQTGEPLIDACMRELNQTGYLTNRGRQIAASYLINELAIDWRLGASYFERVLIDYDVASNWGNWQYIAGVGVDPRGGRHFNIEKQQKSHDPKGHYIKKWSTYEVTSGEIKWSDLKPLQT